MKVSSCSFSKNNYNINRICKSSFYSCSFKMLGRKQALYLVS